VANTGAALWYVHNNIFNTEYDRPEAKNVIYLVTDKLSDDDIGPPSRALRESGVTVRNLRKVRRGLINGVHIVQLRVTNHYHTY